MKSYLRDLLSKYHNCIKEYTKSVGKTQTKTRGDMLDEVCPYIACMQA